MKKFIGCLRLMRLANIVTAISDILAGVAIAGYADIFFLYVSYDSSAGITRFGGFTDSGKMLLLILSTIGLYGGGVVFNDVFDAELDKIERPERPIPSGLVSKTVAAGLGAVLLLVGVLAAAFVHDEIFSISLWLAVLITIGALVYDKWGKHHAVLGPLNMGACRGLNLLLGMSIIPAAINQFWMLALVPVAYIAAITMISRGEVHGGRKSTLIVAFALYALVISAIVTSALLNSPGMILQNTVPYTCAFLLLFAFSIFPPLIRAMKDPRGPLIGKAVKAGVISLIIMNASWAAAFGNISLSLIILLLLPISIRLAKAFAVT